jgi:uncharacterized protein
MFTFKHANQSIELIDNFLNTIDQGGLIFREGVKNYLQENRESFADNLKTLAKLETEADVLKRKIENILYTHSLMPQLRGDILKLIDELDTILNQCKKSLFQFDVEVPYIPTEIHQDLIKLTDICISAVESLIPAARAYFKDPDSVKEKIHRVYLYENEADKLADAIKRRVFQQMPHIEKLSEKFHLRYFTLHIETISDKAEDVADLLSIMAIKRTL